MYKASRIMAKKGKKALVRKKITIILIIFIMLIIGTIITYYYFSNDSDNIKISNSVYIPEKFSGEVKIGTPVPNFQLNNVLGGLFDYKKYSSKVILLSFIHGDTNLASDKNKDSFSQIDIFKNVYKEYETKGLKVILVNSSYLNTGKDANNDILVNLTYDKMLNNLILLSDTKDKKLAESFNVKKLPTTYLISTDNKIEKIWDGLAANNDIMLEVKKLLGDSKTEADKNAPTLEQTDPLDKTWSTISEKKFPDYDPARKLSDNIWVIDGGHKWSSIGPQFTTWVVFSDTLANLKIKANAKQILSGKEISLMDADLNPASSIEAEKLLTNFPEKKTKVYLLSIPVTLPGLGKCEVNATVYEKNSNKIIYTGSVKVEGKGR